MSITGPAPSRARRGPRPPRRHPAPRPPLPPAEQRAWPRVWPRPSPPWVSMPRAWQPGHCWRLRVGVWVQERAQARARARVQARPLPVRAVGIHGNWRRSLWEMWSHLERSRAAEAASRQSPSLETSPRVLQTVPCAPSSAGWRPWQGWQRESASRLPALRAITRSRA